MQGSSREHHIFTSARAKVLGVGLRVSDFRFERLRMSRTHMWSHGLGGDPEGSCLDGEGRRVRGG